eukprot:gene333-425_t
MASMTDIISILLMFFMLTVSFPNATSKPIGLTVDLPTSQSTHELVAQIQVTITARLDCYVDNESISLENLAQHLKGKISLQNNLVLLQIDQSVPVQYMIKVFDIANSLHAQVALLIGAYLYYFPMYASAPGDAGIPRTMALNLQALHTNSTPNLPHHQTSIATNTVAQVTSPTKSELPMVKKVPTRVIEPLANPPEPLLSTNIVQDQPEVSQEQPIISTPDQPIIPTDNPNAASQGEATEATPPTVDDRGIYAPANHPTKATGASLELTGWIWDVVPQPNDDTPEIGKLVFEITIDDNGEIVAIKTLEKTVSPFVEQLYKDEVSKLAFSKTNAHRMYTPTSTGKPRFDPLNMYYEEAGFENLLYTYTVDTLSYKTQSANKQTVEKSWILVDARGQALGRLSSQIASIIRGKNKPYFTPHVDCGDNVVVINAEKIKLTGKKWDDKQYISHTGHPGGQRTTTPRKMKEKFPTRIIELAVRRMLPKNRLGRRLFHNLFVYAGQEHAHNAQQPKEIKLTY